MTAWLMCNAEFQRSPSAWLRQGSADASETHSSARSCRRVDRQLQRRIVIGLEARILELQQSLVRMVQPLPAVGHATDIMGFPPCCKFAAASSQPRQEIDEGRIAGPQIMRSTKLCDHPPRLVAPRVA